MNRELFFCWIQVLLKGANGDELKKVKHVVQYGVFAAYHLALETSFLVDEGASLPELPLKSPITVALPEKPSSIERSISMIHGFPITSTLKPPDIEPETELQNLDRALRLNRPLSENMPTTSKFGHCSWNAREESAWKSASAVSEFLSMSYCSGQNKVGISNELPFPEKNYPVDAQEFAPTKSLGSSDDLVGNSSLSHPSCSLDKVRENVGNFHVEGNDLSQDYTNNLKLAAAKEDGNIINQDMVSSKEEFPPTPSDHQSILVSLSTRCVWKGTGTVCKPAHFFRIKYYGSSDKPLGRFLQDHLFDQVILLNCC